MIDSHIIVRPPNGTLDALQQVRYLQMRGLPADLILRYLRIRYPSLCNSTQSDPQMTTIHIGKIIRQQMKKEKVSPQDMAKRLNIQRPNLYRILRGSTMNTALLYQFSVELRYDFFSLYSAALKPELKKNNKNDTCAVTDDTSQDIVL